VGVAEFDGHPMQRQGERVADAEEALQTHARKRGSGRLDILSIRQILERLFVDPFGGFFFFYGMF
jgi:hypothetical protein